MLITLLLAVAVVGGFALAVKLAWVGTHDEAWMMLGLHVTPGMAVNMTAAATVITAGCTVALVIRMMLRAGSRTRRDY